MKYIKNLFRFMNRVKYELIYKESELQGSELGKRWARLQWYKNRKL
jgi:hypothetical protein